jgi:hypothetical protein
MTYNKSTTAVPHSNSVLSPAIILLSLLMGCKVFYLAFFVTPLWHIPDETGHLSYVIQIASGGGVPVLGDAIISPEITSYLQSKNLNTEFSLKRLNWIAQHPPLYYFLAAIPYWVVQQFTTDVEILFRVPRIISVFSAVLLLLVIYRTARHTGLSEKAALCLAGCVGWIPMVSNLSSGTNHDVTLFLFSALTFHYLTRFVLYHQNRDAYVAAIWLSLAGAIKMTAWVLLPPFAMIIALELRGTYRPWLIHLSGITTLVFSLPAAWMLRNFFVYGNAFQTATSSRSLSEPLQTSIFSFLASFNVIEGFLLHFYGLFGWVHYGLTALRGLPLVAFTLLLIVFSLVLLIHFTKITIYHKITGQAVQPRFAETFIGNNFLSILFLRCRRILSFVLIVIVFFILTYFSMKGGLGMNIRLVAISVIVALGAGAIISVLCDYEDKNRLFYYGLLAFFFFSFIIFFQIYEIYLKLGQLRAIHGRYFYPVLPWLLASVSLAFAHLVWGQRLLILLFIILIIAETDAYINQVLQFFARGQ